MNNKIIRTYSTQSNETYQVELIGYVVGIKYNSEGTIIDWLFGKTDLCGHTEKPRIFKTIKSAQNFINKKKKYYNEEMYYRQYEYHKFINK